MSPKKSSKPAVNKGTFKAYHAFVLLALFVFGGAILFFYENNSANPYADQADSPTAYSESNNVISLYIKAKQEESQGNFIDSGRLYYNLASSQVDLPVGVLVGGFFSSLNSGNYEKGLFWLNQLDNAGEEKPKLGLIMESFLLWKDDKDSALAMLETVLNNKSSNTEITVGSGAHNIASSAKLWLMIDNGKTSPLDAINSIDEMIPVLRGQEGLNLWVTSHKILLYLSALNNNLDQNVLYSASEEIEKVADDIIFLPQEVIKAAISILYKAERLQIIEGIINKLATTAVHVSLAEALTLNLADYANYSIDPKHAFLTSCERLAIYHSSINAVISFSLLQLASAVDSFYMPSKMATAKMLINAANFYDQNKNIYMLAMNLLNQVDDPLLNFEKMLEKARVYSSIDEPEKALDVLTVAANQWNKTPYAFVQRGNVLRIEKQYDKSISDYSKAIELNLNLQAQEDLDWRLYFWRGISYERTDQWELAEKDFFKALEINPNQPQVLNYLGYSWIDQQLNLDEALAMVENAVSQNPNSGYILDSLGWAYYRLYRYQDAVTELEKAVELSPLEPVINDHLGDAYWRVGRKKEAKFQWEKSLLFDKDTPELDSDAKTALEEKLKSGLK